MKVTHAALQKYFAQPLPSVTEIADAFTFHCFEIEEIAGDTLDIKVLPNRAADCTSEAGIAAELSSILDLPLAAPRPLDYKNAPTVSVSRARINSTLGSDFSAEEIEDVFRRLQFQITKKDEHYTVQAPFPRTDIQIPEDVIEEVGRIVGYDRILPAQLPAAEEVSDQARFRGIERMKDQLVEQGFTEVSTQSFMKTGDSKLANPLDKEKPALRTTLEKNLEEALAKAKQYAPRVLPPKTEPKLFEVGSVFPKAGEYLELRMTERVPVWGDQAGLVDNLSVAKLEDYGKDYVPKRYSLGTYTPFSLYPFIVRDIALWVPGGTERAVIETLIREHAGELLVRLDQFDRFEKEERVSYAFRLVFESMERTLTDEEVNAIMKKVTAALQMHTNWEVR